MNRLLKIDNVMFYTTDIKKASEFYEKVLKLKKGWTDDENNMVGFTLAESGSEIVLHTDSNLPNPFFSFLVENVEDFCREYQEKGYAVMCEPFDVRCGKFAILADVDGNPIPLVDLTNFDGNPQYDDD